MNKTKYPLTVRDCQRIISAYQKDRYRFWGMPQKMMQAIDDFEQVNDLAALSKRLDMLAATNGPDHIIISSPESPSGDSRPKGTDEVAPQSDNPAEDSPLHGGDGASGEVEDGQSLSTEKGDHMQNGDGSVAGTGTNPTGGATSPCNSGPDNSDPRSDQPAAETDTVTSAETDTSPPEKNGRLSPPDGDPGNRQADKSALSAGQDDPRDNPDAKKKTDGADTSTVTLTDRANLSALCAGTGDERATEPKEVGDEEEGSSENSEYHYRKGGTRPSTQSKNSHGGVTAKMRRVGITASLVKRAGKAIGRLTDGGENETGPRYDWKEFSIRLKSYRPLSPARKEETGRPAILVLADVSGSCAGFSDRALLVAQAVGKLGLPGQDIIVVAHSNGSPEEWAVNGGGPAPIDIPWDASIAWYEKSLQHFTLQAVIALGDWDAEWLYHSLAEKAHIKRFVWLDNWSCRTLPPTVRPDLFKASRFGNPWRFGEPWGSAAKNKTTYVVGCDTAEDFLTGLKLALKRR